MISSAQNGWTALHEAAFNGHTALAALLLDRGADVNRADEEVSSKFVPARGRTQTAAVAVIVAVPVVVVAMVAMVEASAVVR